MIEIPEYLELALAADDRDRLQRIIERAAPDDFALLQALVADDDTPPNYRRKAMFALGQWPGRNDEAVATIAAALPELTELERITAVDALGRIGTEAALDVVLNCVEDDEPDVRRQVVKALDEIGSGRAVAALDRIAASENVDYVRALAEEKVQDARRRKGGGR